MKILHLNTHDTTGGAARAVIRLHNGLQNTGINSTICVQFKKSDHYTIHGPASTFSKLYGLIKPDLQNMMQSLFMKDKCYFSAQWFPTSRYVFDEIKTADILHLHWIAGGFIKIEDLKQIKKPIIWTLHDSWPFTGGCHIPSSCDHYKKKCGNCQYLKNTSSSDLSNRIWKRKNKAWKDLNLTIVSPSKWLADCSRQSSLFKDKKIMNLTYGIDTGVFKPIDKKIARNILNLQQDKKLILFGAKNLLTDKNKGFHLLYNALRYLDDEIELVVFGSSKPSGQGKSNIKIHFTGFHFDDVSLALLYSAADLFVAPSIQENFPNTVLESLACGTPCVAFNIGGMPDMIDHKENGYLANPFDTEDLAKGISWVIDDNHRYRLSCRARKKVERNYNITDIAEKYQKLYESRLS